MKGQTQIVSFVLATTIVVTSVAAAFTWGTPFLEERTSELETQNIENKVLELKKSIDLVARSGEGASRIVEMDLGEGEISLEPEEERIRILFPTSEPGYGDEFVLLKGDNRTNTSLSDENTLAVEDENTEGIVGVKGGQSLLEYVIEYRPLIDRSEVATAEKINLTRGSTTVSTGKTEVRLENIGSGQSIKNYDGETMRTDLDYVRVEFK